MTIIPLNENAMIIYDRVNKICVVVVRTVPSLPDAIAIARTLKADVIWIIAPKGAEEYEQSITPTDDYKLYRFK